MEENIIELQCNLDDMTGEEVGFAIERLLEAGAKDAFSYGIQMKKKRSGILLCVLCDENDRERMLETIFKYTSTIGVREIGLERYVLEREQETLESDFGLVHKKVSSGYKTTKEKLEYEDVAAIARKHHMTIKEAKNKILKS